MNFLESVGVCAIGVIIIFLVIILYSIIRELLRDMITKYKIKKRFKKPPIAKCYCRDCEKWDQETGECWDTLNSRRMSASWFCCFAKPLTGDRFKEREKQFKEGGTK